MTLNDIARSLHISSEKPLKEEDRGEIAAALLSTGFNYNTREIVFIQNVDKKILYSIVVTCLENVLLHESQRND